MMDALNFEGVYLKVEMDGHVVSRGKVVRIDFVPGNTHWTKFNLRMNKLLSDPPESEDNVVAPVRSMTV